MLKSYFKKGVVEAGCDEAGSSWEEKGERQEEFDEEHRAAEDGENLGRELVGEPGQRIWQGLREEMEIERAQVWPIGIAARELHDAGGEHQLEQQRHRGEAGESRRLGGSRIRQKAPGGEEDREKSRFDQERVPLKAVKILPGHAQREHHRPQGEKAERLQNSKKGSE